MSLWHMNLACLKGSFIFLQLKNYARSDQRSFQFNTIVANQILLKGNPLLLCSSLTVIQNLKASHASNNVKPSQLRAYSMSGNKHQGCVILSQTLFMRQEIGAVCGTSCQPNPNRSLDHNNNFTISDQTPLRYAV